MSKSDFRFADDEDEVARPGDRLIRVPNGLGSKAALLDGFAREADFPPYFGRSWDAFVDCVGDLTWIAEHRIVVFHHDLPLHQSERDLATYLDIFGAAIEAQEEHRELIVSFPRRCRSIVMGLVR